MSVEFVHHRMDKIAKSQKHFLSLKICIIGYQNYIVSSRYKYYHHGLTVFVTVLHKFILYVIQDTSMFT